MTGESALHGGFEHAAHRDHFALLHGKADALGALVAVDDLDRQVEIVLQHERMLAGDGRRRRCAEDDFLQRAFFLHVEDVVERGDVLTAAIPDAEARRVLVHRADPRELAGVVLGFLVAEQRFQRGRCGEHADGRAVLRRRVVQEVCGIHRARACHVLDHDRRVARNMLRHVRGHEARDPVVAAARAVADEDAKLLACIEIADRVGLRRRGRQQHCRRAGEGGERAGRSFDSEWSHLKVSSEFVLLWSPPRPGWHSPDAARSLAGDVSREQAPDGTPYFVRRGGTS